jgi:hypothetical protein
MSVERGVSKIDAGTVLLRFVTLDWGSRPLRHFAQLWSLCTFSLSQPLLCRHSERPQFIFSPRLFSLVVAWVPFQPQYPRGGQQCTGLASINHSADPRKWRTLPVGHAKPTL